MASSLEATGIPLDELQCDSTTASADTQETSEHEAPERSESTEAPSTLLELTESTPVRLRQMLDCCLKNAIFIRKGDGRSEFTGNVKINQLSLQKFTGLWPSSFKRSNIGEHREQITANSDRGPKDYYIMSSATYLSGCDGYPKEADLPTELNRSIAPLKGPLQGKAWYFQFSHSQIRIDQLALLLCCMGNPNVPAAPDGDSSAFFADMQFIDAFARNYETKRVAACISPIDSLKDHRGKSGITLQYRMDYFGYDPKRPSPIPTDVVLFRDTARIGDSHLHECVAAVSLRFINTMDAPYIVTILADDAGILFQRNVGQGPRLQWTKCHIIPCGQYTGVAQFLVSILSLADLWEKGWMNALDRVDNDVQFKMEYTLDDKMVEKFMFDDSFRQSKIYFIVLQFLRTAGSRVDRTINDWKALYEEWMLMTASNTIFEEPITENDLADVQQNWHVATLRMEDTVRRVRRRIDMKIEEVKSLRDGLFNATAL